MTPACPVHQISADADRDAFAADVRRGMAQQPKRLPSKYFYDARGSELFEQICDLPEYYLTRTELAILEGCASEIADTVGPSPLLVEYGSGSGIKTRRLLAALDRPVGYVPIEISESALDASVESLREQFPDVEMRPLCADFTAPVSLPATRRKHRHIVLFFPGSTLGNFEAREAISLLRNMRNEIGAEGFAVVGIDLKKDRATIEAAYNDSAGVTREFTLNLLDRMNRELDADFDRSQFRHRAVYNAMAGRIETHIVSQANQQVSIDGRRVPFGEDEAMLVEYSCKYSQGEFEHMAAKAGLKVVRQWSDPQQLFAIELLQRA